MDEDQIDPFSSFTIQCRTPLIISQASSPERCPSDPIFENQNFKCQKLKPRRKSKEIVDDGSSLETYSCSYKLKVKYDGFFRAIKNGTKQKYCFEKLKTLNLDPISFGSLLEELNKIHPLQEEQVFSLCFLNNNTNQQSFIPLEDNNSFKMMLSMYEKEKEIMIFVTVQDKNIYCGTINMTFEEGVILRNDEDDGADNNFDYEDGSNYCHSESSYHSRYSSDEDYNIQNSDKSGNDDSEFEEEVYSYDKDKPEMAVGAQYPNVTAFRRALNHYALTTDFEYSLEKSDPKRVTARCAKMDCSWRIHASTIDDGITFVIKTLQPNHSCSGVNKCGNKHASKGWIADRVISDLRIEGDIPTYCLKKKLERKYGIQIPYQRVWKGKELAMDEIYGKWDDSFIQIGAFKEEILKSNIGSVVDFKTEPVQVKNKKRKCTKPAEESQHFQRFFIALNGCIIGFLRGCRPYVGIDACHLKGKWNGFLAAATALDGNNCMFPVAYGVIENESEDSWEWFLTSLSKAIGMPEGLVISSDMQKGLVKAVSKVFPLAEHGECMVHLGKNFKKHFSGKPIRAGLWAAARTYSPNRFERIMTEMKKICPATIQYLEKEHSKLWSRSKFSTTAKVDNFTNNIAETFNSWICEERQKPVLDLLDSIRKKIMVRFYERRQIARKWKGSLVPKVDQYIKNISRDLGGYVVNRSSDLCAEVEQSEKGWKVNLVEKSCTCREWQLSGIPCIHAAAFIASIRNAKWEDYVDPYFTVERFKATYAGEITAMPSRHEWMECNLGYKMLPPIIKRPPGRPRKSRIKASDEPKKKSNKCSRCNLPGHHKNTCKNEIRFQLNEETESTEATQGSTTERVKGKTRAKKTVCTENFLRILQEENI